MGSLILCHDQHAAHPYEITRIHCKIFTMEELCYYLCNNLYLIDYTIMNEQLCGWLEEDIGKRELADQLRGSLILCHDQHAAHPYEITRIHCKIFTMEELCYYLCNNLYLIDYTIMNEQLCGWLEEDIGKRELADQLRDVIRMRGSVEKFVLTILKSSGIYKEAEMIRIQNVLERLKNQPEGH